MKVGVAIPQRWGDPAASMRELNGFLTDADTAGFDGLWVQEQLLGSDPSFEPISILNYAAACTTRVRLGTAGVVTPLRSPLAVAKAFATLDQLSLGRVDAGLVLGEMREAYAASGRRWSDRGPRFEDAVRVITALWRQDSVTHVSPYGELHDARITPPPVQPGGPPLWLGGHSPAALDRIARLADGWIGAGGISVERWVRSSRTLDQIVVGSRRPALQRSKKLYVWLGDDDARAFDALSRWFAAHWHVADGDELAREVGVWGSDERVLDIVATLSQNGATSVILNPVGDERAQLTRIAENLLPALHALG